MDFGKKRLIGVIFTFFLLLASALTATYSLNRNSKLLNDIESTQLRLTLLSIKLSKYIQSNQSNVLQALVLREDELFQKIDSNSKKIFATVNEISSCIENKRDSLPKASQYYINTIKKRIKAYKSVEHSLLEAIKAADEQEIQDALVGFNATATAFTGDIFALIDLTNDLLKTQVEMLQKFNDKTNTVIYLSYIFTVVILLITIYLTFRYQKKMQQELKRAENAERESNSLKNQLAIYNRQLETEIELKKKELYDRIYKNATSGFYNRNKLIEDIDQQKFHYLALLNIDSFQKFNDVYGEEYGNIALEKVANFIYMRIQPGIMEFYHIGGDEFVITVLNGATLPEDDFVNFVQQILKDCRSNEFQHKDTKFLLTLTAGISFGGMEKILAYADMALKEAKEKNINLSIFQGDTLEEIHKGDIECHRKLLNALENDNITIFLQPIVPIQNPKLPVKYESLVRMIDSDGSIIPPFNFLRVAKRNRIYYKITQKVIKHAFETVSRYNIPLSINISMADITNFKTLQTIYKQLENFSYCELITFELLETEDFEDYESVYEFCVNVKKHGAKLSLDDFGSGYSNFSHIIHLPIDFIKIDASLISNITRDHASQIMVETIVSLAKKIKAKTIAEFVSSQEILEVITELGIDYAQGFYLGKPETISHYVNTN